MAGLSVKGHLAFFPFATDRNVISARQIIHFGPGIQTTDLEASVLRRLRNNKGGPETKFGNSSRRKLNVYACLMFGCCGRIDFEFREFGFVVLFC